MYESFDLLSKPLCLLAGYLASIYRALMYLSADLSVSLLKEKLSLFILLGKIEVD